MNFADTDPWGRSVSLSDVDRTRTIRRVSLEDQAKKFMDQEK